MDDMSSSLPAIETALSSGIRIIGGIIEILGVLVIVSGIAWSTILFVRRQQRETHYDSYKIRIGRSLLLGLEVLVAADIVKTIALQLTFVSLGLLAGLVLVRRFLSWTLVLEIEGCWPWRRERPGTAPHAIMNDVVWRDIETNQSQAVGMRMRPSND